MGMGRLVLVWFWRSVIGSGGEGYGLAWAGVDGALGGLALVGDALCLIGVALWGMNGRLRDRRGIAIRVFLAGAQERRGWRRRPAGCPEPGRLQRGGPVASAGNRGDEAGGPGSAVLAWSPKMKAKDRWIRSSRTPA